MFDPQRGFRSLEVFLDPHPGCGRLLDARFGVGRRPFERALLRTATAEDMVVQAMKRAIEDALTNIHARSAGLASHVDDANSLALAL